MILISQMSNGVFSQCGDKSNDYAEIVFLVFMKLVFDSGAKTVGFSCSLELLILFYLNISGVNTWCICFFKVLFY
jgi:hypothetical protein